MSATLYITGYLPPDDKWNQMKAVYEACDKANVEIPEEVEDFFDCEPPGDRPGREIDLTMESYCNTWRGDMAEGYEIKLESIPDHIKIIRVCNQY